MTVQQNSDQHSTTSQQDTMYYSMYLYRMIIDYFVYDKTSEIIKLGCHHQLCRVKKKVSTKSSQFVNGFCWVGIVVFFFHFLCSTCVDTVLWSFDKKEYYNEHWYIKKNTIIFSFCKTSSRSGMFVIDVVKTLKTGFDNKIWNLPDKKYCKTCVKFLGTDAGANLIHRVCLVFSPKRRFIT